jgi:hypothetical protein
MVLLLRHYNIVGHVPSYPIAGVGDSGWWCWYQLALAIAAELDDSLKIVESKPRGKTAPRWRGDEGRLLLRMVDLSRDQKPGRGTDWYLDRLQKRYPTYYGRIAFKQLKSRYYEALKHHRGTKHAHNNRTASY